MEIKRVCKPGWKNCKMPELRQRIAELEAALLEAMEWNWMDSDFPLNQFNSNKILCGKSNECMSDQEYAVLKQEQSDG